MSVSTPVFIYICGWLAKKALREKLNLHDDLATQIAIEQLEGFWEVVFDPSMSGMVSLRAPDGGRVHIPFNYYAAIKDSDAMESDSLPFKLPTWQQTKTPCPSCGADRGHNRGEWIDFRDWHLEPHDCVRCLKERIDSLERTIEGLVRRDD